MINKYNLFLSSNQRLSGGDPSNFEISIKPNIGLTKGRNTQFRIYVHSATIPFSWTQWSSVNNTTKFQFTQSSKTFTGSFSIPAGNYTILTFMSAWITSLETQLGVLNAYFPNITYTYNSDTNQVNIVLPNDLSGTVITFFNTTGYTEVNKALGFTSQWVLSTTQSATSTTQCNINPARVLYLYSNTLASPHNYEALVTPCTTSTQIAAIPITVLPNQYIVYTPFNYLISTIANKNFSKINLQLQSEDLPENINLQNFNLDWSLVLCFEEWEVVESSVSKIDHFLELQDQRDKAKTEEIERQRNVLEEERQAVINSLLKIKKKTKKNLDDIVKNDE